MAKIVIKKLPPGPRPTRDRLDLRGYSELSWPAAVKLAGKSGGNTLHVELTIDYWVDEHSQRESLVHIALLDVKGALARARGLVQNGQAREVSVEGRAEYCYPGARPAIWHLGGFKRVEYWEVVETLAGMPGGHDYYDNSNVKPHGAPIADLATRIGISKGGCYSLLREAESYKLVETWHDLARWYAVRYWKMELAKIEREAALNAMAKDEAGR